MTKLVLNILFFCVFFCLNLSAAAALTCEEGLFNRQTTGECYNNGVCTGASIYYERGYFVQMQIKYECALTNNMYCQAGYYGIPKSTADGQCKSCPSHGVCELGANSVLKCKTGYSASSGACVAQSITCAAGKYLNASNVCYTCTAGYYCPGGTFTANDSIQGRTKCPDWGATSLEDMLLGYSSGSGTSASGADSITKCYRATGTGFKDSAGTYNITGKCYYE